ncbi:MAG: helix-turn-helix transcriptional regulator [Paeniclostridium sordellii]|nr:helix-turn-helix transcriptional regulator [Paeniclostridium sordellii]
MSYLIGQKIKQIRKSQDIKQEVIAEKLEISRQKYSRIENGQSNIGYITLEKISKVLGVDIRELTSANEEKQTLTHLFREKNNNSSCDEAIEKIETILKYFHAHEKLYYQMEEKN